MPQTVDRIDFACADLDPSRWPKLSCGAAGELALQDGNLRISGNGSDDDDTVATGGVIAPQSDGGLQITVPHGPLRIERSGPNAWALDVQGWIGSRETEGETAQVVGGWRLGIGEQNAQAPDEWLRLTRADTPDHQNLAVGNLLVSGDLIGAVRMTIKRIAHLCRFHSAWRHPVATLW